MDASLDGRHEAMLHLLREAGAIAHGHFARRDELTVEHKGVQDFVSAADREVEAFLRHRVLEAFPEDGFLGEEQGFGNAQADSFWIVDPIDGTTNFLRGLPHYAVSIAFVRGGITELAGVYAPELAELYSARRGLGTYLNGRRARVSPTASLKNALVGLGYSQKSPAEDYVRTVESLLAFDALYRLFGSAALMLCQVAVGRLDGAFEAHLSAWDALGPLLMVREAGGFSVPDERDEAGWRAGPVLAGNGPVFHAMKALARVQP